AARRRPVGPRGGRGCRRPRGPGDGGGPPEGGCLRRRASARRRRRARNEPDRLGRRAILLSARATIVLVVWVALAVANGLYFTFSGFLVPLAEEFPWSPGLTAGARSLSTVLPGLLSPVAGILVDRFGPRRIILSGAVLLSAASILPATIRSGGG